MGQIIKIVPEQLIEIRTVDERMVSYNVEMTEVTGGTFWREYTKEQIAGTEKFPEITDFTQMGGLMQVYEPIDLTTERIRTLTKRLGPAYVRVSGSWASNTYYDFDGHTNGVIPEGFEAILTARQWENLLDFVKEVDGKLLISVANCIGAHNEDGSWNSEQAKLLFDFSREYGVPIDYAEFMNEPNMACLSGAPKGYTEKDFGRDQDAFFRFVRENYPETQLVGPCACGDCISEDMPRTSMTDQFFKTKDLLEVCEEKADIFSYHCYAGVSERGAVMGGHWDEKDALSESYFDVVAHSAAFYGKLRDTYCEGAPMWVTESGDAGCGGNTWASTFLDTFRTADEFGRFSEMTDGAIFHNTLASSDYGYLDHKTHLPRPNYWVALLWNQIMGTTVYDTGEEKREGVHVYAHSRKDGKEGYAYMVINNSRTDSTFLAIPAIAERYTLSAEDLRSSKMMLNGVVLESEGVDATNEFIPYVEMEGTIELKPETITFLVL